MPIEGLGGLEVAAVDLGLGTADPAAGVGHDHPPGHQVGELLGARLAAGGDPERGRAGDRLMIEYLRRRLIAGGRGGEEDQRAQAASFLST